MDPIQCGGFEFVSNFDSGNLARVELVSAEEISVPDITNSPTGKSSPAEDIPDFEFNLWTKLDCAGTEFENTNRTWFYFGIKGGAPFALLKLNIVNLNKQSKMYSQGMAPVFRITPGRSQWERIKDRPTYTVGENNFTLSFKYRTLENLRSTTYFAFTYPYTYAELQSTLLSVDARFSKRNPQFHVDDIYYHRECACFTPEGRRVDLITISSLQGIGSVKEPRLKHLFPESGVPRPFRFPGKKVVFVSARVHPGETPSSFVFNGLLNVLLNREDQIGIALRKNFVFKLIPMLNPDGVAKGHYRTDVRGVNLNRVYLKPSATLHPSVFAARALVRYYHHGFEPDDEPKVESDLLQTDTKINEQNLIITSDCGDTPLSPPESPSHSAKSCLEKDQTVINKVSKIESQVSGLTLNEKDESTGTSSDGTSTFSDIGETLLKTVVKACESSLQCVSDPKPHPESDLKSSSVVSKDIAVKPSGKGSKSRKTISAVGCGPIVTAPEDSGLFLYIDLHGHASKKGIFMYGNHFENVDDSVECMLLPKIMAINSQNFHFTACNFTERNMYLKDRRDGMSREGSGRVAVLKATGLVRSYTLECNYNTGGLVNVLPPCVRDAAVPPTALLVPPKYTPAVFEEIGRAMGISMLDLCGTNPWSRIPNSEFRTLNGIRDWLRKNCVPEQMYLRKQQQSLRKQSSSQVAGSSSGSSRVRLPGTRNRRLVPLRHEPKPPVTIPPADNSDRKENLIGCPTTSQSTSGRMSKNCAELDENVGPDLTQRTSLVKSKNISNPSSGLLKQIIAVQTKCTVVKAIGKGGKMKGLLSHPMVNTGVGLKKSQPLVTASSRLAKFRKMSGAAKLVDLSHAFCTSANRTKAGQLMVDRKLARLAGQRSEQTLSKGPKRIKLVALKVEQASCSRVADGEAQCSTSIDAMASGSSLVAKKKGEDLFSRGRPDDVTIPLYAEDKLASPWNLNQSAGHELDGIPQTLKNKGKLQQRKMIGQSKATKPSISFLRSVDSDSYTGSSSSSKHSTKLEKKSSKTKGSNLNPVKGLYKSPSFVKKKNSELVKKRGKVSLKSLASSVGKFRVPSTEQAQGAVTEKKRKKVTPHFL